MINACDARIRVFELTTVFAIGGTERQLVNLANRIDPSRFDLHLGCLKRWGSFLGELAPTAHPVAEFPISSLYAAHTVQRQLQLARYLRRERIEVFHAHGFYADVFGVPAARLAGVPVTIASVRDQGDSRTRLQELALRASCGLADAVLVNAEAVRERLVWQGYAPAKIRVVHNGVDDARFTAPAREGQVRASLGIPPDAPLVMAVCRLSPVKGLEFLLEAAAQVVRRAPSARFVIVGDALTQPGAASVNPYRKQLELRCAQLGLERNVVFAGFRLDVPELLAHATVSVLPSLSEGLSNTLLESMAAGIPVVATEVGGNPEVVEHGVTGWLVPPRDPDALASAISEVIEHPEQAARFGQAGRRRALAQFSIGRMVQRTEQLYQVLLHAAQPRRAARGVSREPPSTSQPDAS